VWRFWQRDVGLSSLPKQVSKHRSGAVILVTAE